MCEFWFDLIQANLAPDGRERWTLTINGTIPGPTIIVNWGDTVVIHLRNKLPASLQNGTSIHFHGIRQLNANPMDGVVSITQCPIAPDQTMTYRWRATQYGTTWYHSHIGLQTWEGVFGGIIINGPASANYDEDMGTILLNDWDVRTVDELWGTAQSSSPPAVDNALINGTNVFGEEGENQVGRRFEMSFRSGKSYRLRLGNAACDTHFKFSIDRHDFTMIVADLVPVQPYTTTVLDVAIGKWTSHCNRGCQYPTTEHFLTASRLLIAGQRYDIIVHANQAALGSAFWLRATPQLSCSRNLNADNIRGIIYYDDGNTNTTSIPNSTAYTYTDSCRDEDPSNLIPIVSQTLDLTPSEQFYNETVPVTIALVNSIYHWQLNGTSLALNWTDPTLRTLHTKNQHTRANRSSHSSLPTNTISIPEPETWVLILISSTLPIPHPIHLHGHDFLLLSQGPGPYPESTLPTKPILYAAGALPKRDTALLPAGGHLALAFRSDNPGVWLLHCHVGWHLEQGFAVQIVEQEKEVCGLLGEGGEWARWTRELEGNCVVWDKYVERLQG